MQANTVDEFERERQQAAFEYGDLKSNVTLVDAIKRIDEVDQREAAKKYIDLDLAGRTSGNSTGSTDSMFNCMNSLILKNTY